MSSRGRYRFEEWPGGTDVQGESAATIDGAIALARQLSRTDAHKAHGVAVIDTEKPKRARGVSEGGDWRWAAACSPCIGTGRVAYYASDLPCGRCHGKGWIPDDCARAVA